MIHFMHRASGAKLLIVITGSRQSLHLSLAEARKKSWPLDENSMVN